MLIWLFQFKTSIWKSSNYKKLYGFTEFNPPPLINIDLKFSESKLRFWYKSETLTTTSSPCRITDLHYTSLIYVRGTRFVCAFLVWRFRIVENNSCYQNNNEGCKQKRPNFWAVNVKIKCKRPYLSLHQSILS